MIIEQKTFDEALQRVYDKIEDNVRELNFSLSLNLLVWANKYRMMYLEQGFSLRKFTSEKKSLETAIKHIIGVYNVRIEQRNITNILFHVEIEPTFFYNAVFNYEFHKDIKWILDNLIPNQLNNVIILYPYQKPTVE